MAVAALALHWLVRAWAGDRLPFLFFMLALVIAAVRLGRGPAFAMLAVGIVNRLAQWPRSAASWLDHPADLFTLLAFLAIGTLVALYGSRLRVISARAAQAEQRLSLAQDETGVGLFELDFQSNTALVSPSLCQLVGQPVFDGPLPLADWLARLHQGHVEDSRRTLQQMVDRGQLRYEREQEVALPDGSRRWLLTRVRIELDADRRLALARGAAMDITARKEADGLLEQARAELWQQVDDLQRLHAVGQRLVAAGDGLDEPLQAVLQLAADLHGAPGCVLLLCAGDGDGDVGSGQTLAGHVGLDASDAQALCGQAPLAGLCAQLGAAHERVVVAELPAPLPQAGVRALHATPVRGSDGRLLGAMVVLFDRPHAPDARERRLADICAVTATSLIERDRARTAANRASERFQVTLESSSIPFSILAPVRDADGSVIDFTWDYVNAAGERAIGFPSSRLLGHRIGEVLPGVWVGQPMFDAYIRVIEQDAPQSFEFRSSRDPNTWFHVVASPLQGSVAVWFTDISDRKLRERSLHEADRRKDEFLAVLAHELRNPLAPIRQAAQLAGSAKASEAQRRWSHEVIERQVRRMAALLDDLLDVSRITRGSLVLRRSSSPLSAVIDTAVETARPLIEAKRHKLVLDLPAAPPLLHVDALRLSQVVGNLLTNAAKYTDAGGDIRLRVRHDASGCTIDVRDNGIGLAPAHCEQVFEMFAQVPASLGRSQDGLGIGLALARSLVALHGGSLTAHSDGPGHGSRFTVQLPAGCLRLPAEPAQPGLPAAASSTLPAAATDHRRILLADDNQDAADSLAALLRLHGHAVDLAYDGSAALAAFERQRPDVALLDVGMPRLDGLAVARAIRQLPGGATPLLVAVTGWGQTQDRELALGAGFDHHLTKPVDADQLLALIARP